MKGRVRRSVAALVLALSVSLMASPAAQAAEECRGVVQCWDQRVRECISNLSLPPGRC